MVECVSMKDRKADISVEELKRLPISELAARYNVSERTIYRYKKAARLTERIGQILGYSSTRVSNLMERYNLPRRPVGRIPRSQRITERHGEEKVREWYEGLPWKAGPLRNFQ